MHSGQPQPLNNNQITIYTYSAWALSDCWTVCAAHQWRHYSRMLPHTVSPSHVISYISADIHLSLKELPALAQSVICQSIKHSQAETFHRQCQNNCSYKSELPKKQIDLTKREVWMPNFLKQSKQINICVCCNIWSYNIAWMQGVLYGQHIFRLL